MPTTPMSLQAETASFLSTPHGEDDVFAPFDPAIPLAQAATVNDTTNTSGDGERPRDMLDILLSDDDSPPTEGLEALLLLLRLPAGAGAAGLVADMAPAQPTRTSKRVAASLQAPRVTTTGSTPSRSANATPLKRRESRASGGQPFLDRHNRLGGGDLASLQTHAGLKRSEDLYAQEASYAKQNACVLSVRPPL